MTRLQTIDFPNFHRTSVGFDNLFDVDTPILGDNQEQSNTYPATYDVFGRTVFVKYTLQF
mgnify:CR=1 FL=1